MILLLDERASPAEDDGSIKNGLTHMRKIAVLSTLMLVTSFGMAQAHPGHMPGGLMNGFLHPLSGIDHIVAMVAVGLWAALLGAPAVWVLPIAFPIMMMLGGAMGMMQLPVPQPELMIALSAVVLGAVVAFAARVPVVAAGLLVGFFALFHGYAHGAELPEAANPLAYVAGFVVATAMLHAMGIGIGVLTRWPVGRNAVRVMGAGVAGMGVVFLTAL